MIKFERVDAHAVAQYQESYQLRSGKTTPSELIRQGDSYFVTVCGRRVGGFSLNHAASLRTLEVIPGDKEVTIPHGKLGEINALWLERSLLLRMSLIVFLFCQLKSLGIDEVVAYTTRERLYHSTYATMGSVVIYQGPLKHAAHGIVFTLKPEDMMRNLPRYLINKGKAA